MNNVEQIKQQINILQIAELNGYQPIRKGGTYVLKNNPVRDDGKNSSFTIYPETNSFHDFGGANESGDVIKFIELIENCDFKEAVKIINEKYLNNYQNIIAPQKNTQEVKKLTHEQINNMFNNFKSIDLTVKTQQEHLKTIVPEWLPKEANEDDLAYFMNIGRWCPQEHSMLFKLPNKEGQYLTYKYRYKKFIDKKTGESKITKWAACAGSSAMYLSFNLKHDSNIVLITEGARDFLSASLCGFNVIAQHKSSQPIPDEVLDSNKTYIFIDDNDGKEYLKPIYENAKCTKLYFNHEDWKKYTWQDCKDFSDFLYCFDSLQGFKEAFNKFIDESLDLDWQDRLMQITQPLTIKEIEAAQKQEFLYDELIIKQNITTIVSPPNTGKSAFVFGISDALLDTKKIDNVYFLDPDSNLSYVKTAVERMTKKYDGKFKYFNGVKSTVQDMIRLLDTMSILPKGKGSKSLIICDGLQFFSKGTINDDTTSKDFLELLKLVRDRFGATIILLHHTKKDKDDKGEFNYIGSQFIETATDNMIIMTAKNGSLSAFIKKTRSDKKNNIYDIDIDFKEKEILDVRFVKNKSDSDVDDNEDSDEISEISVVNFLKGKDWTSRSAINKHFKATRKNRKSEKEKMDIIFNILKDSSSIEWNGETGNTARYKSMDSVPVVTEFNDDVVNYDMDELNTLFGGI